MTKKNPLHPGFLIRSLLEEMHVSITAAAEALGVSRQQLHALIAGRAAVSAEMAVRLEISLGSTADFWMRLQQRYDLARMRKLGRPSARKIVAPRKLDGKEDRGEAEGGYKDAGRRHRRSGRASSEPST